MPEPVADGGDLIERLERMLTDGTPTQGGALFNDLITDALEALEALAHRPQPPTGERVTLWRCRECGFLANDRDAWSDKLTAHCPRCGEEENPDPEPVTALLLPSPSKEGNCEVHGSGEAA